MQRRSVILGLTALAACGRSATPFAEAKAGNTPRPNLYQCEGCEGALDARSPA